MLAFCRYRLDPENHLLQRDGRPVALTPKAFEVLVVLVENGARLTTKEELMRRVWPDSFVEEANLTVTISALRRLLGETPEGQPYIATVPRKGYRFAVPVSRVTAEEPAGDASHGATGAAGSERAPAAVEPEENAAQTGLTAPAEIAERRRNWIGPAIAFAAAATVLVLCGLLFRAYQSRSTRSAGATAPRRLAVLPFQNLRPGADTDFLGFSLADAIISKLGYVRELTVRPSYAVQGYTAQPIDVPAVAAKLHVDTLLTGTFLREGDALRITCQLVDVPSQNLLWKGAFDAKYDRLLAVQDEVTQQILRGLELTLSASEAGRLRSEETVSPLAYEFYLRGVDLYARGEFPTATRMLERSTELAPNFTPAWANLGRAYTANASFQFGGAEHYRRAEAAFARAIRLEPDNIDARVYLANMFTDTGRVEKAVPLLRAAVKTNPNHAEVHWELSYAYRFAGMLEASVAESERARAIDPGVKRNSSTANGYLYLGRYAEFLRSLPGTDEVALTAFYRGLVALYRKNPDEAEAGFTRALELDRSLLQAEIGRAFLLGMRRQNGEAQTVLHGLEAKIVGGGVGDPEALYKVAQAYASVGDERSALRVLRLSIENGFFPYPYFAADPLLDPLRHEAGFAPLMDAARERHERFRRAFFPGE